MLLRLACALVLAIALFPLLPIRPAAARDLPMEWDLRSVDGRFYRETSSVEGAGFVVANQDGVDFWSAYRAYGPDVLGYPLSQRFDWNGQPTQVFQRAILQYDPSTRQIAFVNTLDLLADIGADPWLRELFGVPEMASPGTLPSGANVQETARARLALLDAEPKLRAYFDAFPNAQTIFGLPTSTVQDIGDARTVRFQRGVLQLWLKDMPWAKAGDVTSALAGQLAIEAGLFPTGDPFQPIQPPEGPPPVPNLDESIRMNPKSVQIPEGHRWIDIDLTKQRIYAFVDDQAIFWAPMTSGKRGFETPVGRWTIERRVANETMDSRTVGIPRNAPDGYYLKNVRYTQYFAPGGVAIHANYWQPQSVFGRQPTSHGCVGLFEDDAEFFWNFATTGTTVYVHY